MGGFFSKPKAPAPPPGPSQAELDSIARREKQAEETKARESREIAARKRTRRGSQGLMTTFIGRKPEEETGQQTLGPNRNPRSYG